MLKAQSHSLPYKTNGATAPVSTLSQISKPTESLKWRFRRRFRHSPPSIVRSPSFSSPEAQMRVNCVHRSTDWSSRTLIALPRRNPRRRCNPSSEETPGPPPKSRSRRRWTRPPCRFTGGLAATALWSRSSRRRRSHSRRIACGEPGMWNRRRFFADCLCFYLHL